MPTGKELHPQIKLQAPWGNGSMQAIAFRAITDNPRVLHHWLLNGPDGESVSGWAPGQQEIDAMGPDIGMHLAGGMLTLDTHYNNLQGTKDEPDRSGVELCVLEPEHFRKNTASVYMFGPFSIRIPPQSKNLDVTGQCTVTSTTPVTLLNAGPHAHLLAHHMKFTVKKASGELIVMHDGPYNFNEQLSCPLEKPLILSKGDQVITTCTYENDTNQTITFGEDTGSEMCMNFSTY